MNLKRRATAIVLLSIALIGAAHLLCFFDLVRRSKICEKPHATIKAQDNGGYLIRFNSVSDDNAILQVRRRVFHNAHLMRDIVVVTNMIDCNGVGAEYNVEIKSTSTGSVMEIEGMGGWTTYSNVEMTKVINVEDGVQLAFKCQFDGAPTDVTFLWTYEIDSRENVERNIHEIRRCTSQRFCYVKDCRDTEYTETAK